MQWVLLGRLDLFHPSNALTGGLNLLIVTHAVKVIALFMELAADALFLAAPSVNREEEHALILRCRGADMDAGLDVLAFLLIGAGNGKDDVVCGRWVQIRCLLILTHVATFLWLLWAFIPPFKNLISKSFKKNRLSIHGVGISTKKNDCPSTLKPMPIWQYASTHCFSAMMSLCWQPHLLGLCQY